MWIKLLPYLGGFLLLVLVYSIGSSLVSRWEKSIRLEAHTAGVTEERNRQQLIADKATKSLSDGIVEFSKANIAALEKRARVAEASQRRIEDELKNNPVGVDCRVSQRLLDERNAIRQSFKAAPDTSTGS